jgi:hypothetical protein
VKHKKVKLYEDAHKASSNHVDIIKSSKVCGCFYCLRIFNPRRKKIRELIDSEQTVLCPYCGIDSVIGSDSGYPITPEFLKAMYDYWFTHGVEVTYKDGKEVSKKCY